MFLLQYCDIMLPLPLCFTISKPAGSFIRPLHKQAWLSWTTRTAIYHASESHLKFRHWSDLKFFGVVLMMGRFTFYDCVKPHRTSRNVGRRRFTHLCACLMLDWSHGCCMCVYVKWCRAWVISDSWQTLRDRTETERHLEWQLIADIITHSSVV